MTTYRTTTIEAAIEQLDADMARHNLQGHWLYSDPAPEPKGAIQPRLWKWDVVFPFLLRAGELIELETSDARRTVRFVSPGLRTTTHTLHMSMQLVKPDEVAMAHRHTMAALRFVLRGGGAYTNVEGERFPMHPGDLILTPQWTWHDHGNESDDPIVWLDGLDIPLVRFLDAGFFEPYSGAQQPISRAAGYSLHQVGLARPIFDRAPALGHPMIYPWETVWPQLEALAGTPSSPFDGVALEYANPVGGGHTLPSIGCWIQMLRPGERTRRHRHTSCSIFHAFRGEGATVVNDTRLDWGQGDTFVVPNWSWHEHLNRSSQTPAVLFSMNDIPMLEAFGLYREEAA